MGARIFPPQAQDFALDVARGVIPGVSAVNKFGRNPDIDLASDPEDVWDAGGIWVAPTTARTHQIVSTDTNDDGSPAGTGARTVKIFGLDSTGALQEETVTMDGTTNVATANTYTMIHRMFVVTAGSTGNNVGNITATADTDATVTAQITAGQNQTLMAIYRIPLAKTGYLTSWYVSLGPGSGGTADATVEIQAQPNGEVFQVKSVVGVSGGANSLAQKIFNPYAKFEALTTLKIQVEEVDASNADVSAGFDLILVDD